MPEGIELSQRVRIALLISIIGISIGVIAIALTGAGIVPQIDMFRNGTLIAEKEGIDLVEGSGITITAIELSNRVEYTLTSSGAAVGGYATIDDEGVPLPQQTVLNFIGAGVTCVDDIPGSETDCTIPGGGSTNSFETIDAPSGTDPVADSAIDTLQIIVTGTDLSITGDSTLDRLTFDILANAGTDITADLEEETHASEHAIGGADEVAFYGLIDDEGTPLTARRTLNFIGTGVSCVDDGAGAETDCTITSGSTQNLFETINIPGAEDSVADTATDTLNFTETAGIDITGTAATDTINFAFDVLEVTLTNDTFWLGSAGNLAVESTIPDCTDTGGNHLNYTQSTNAVSCGTSSGLQTVEEEDASPITVNVFDFGAGFDVSESPADEANITFDILEVTLTNDSLWVGSASSLAAEAGLPNCVDSGGNHLNYTQSSNSFSCGTSSSFTFNIDGDNNSPQTITSGNEALFAGGTGIVTTASATDTVTFDFDYTATLAANPTLAAGQGVFTSNASGGLIFEGSVADLIETKLLITNPTTIDKTVTFPDNTGTVAVTSSGPITLDTLGDIDCPTCITQAYTTIDDEGTPLTQQSTLNFIGAGVTCVNDGPGSETDCTIAGGAGGEDLQGTYDLETAPALITLTEALGGIFFDGDLETGDPTLTIRDNVTENLGIVLDNDDEVANETSPILRLINSTAGAGDTQFELVVSAADPGSFLIRGDDGTADLTIDSSGNIVGAVDITATTIAGIAAGDLVDKSATEIIAGAWSFTLGITLGDNTDANRVITWDTLTADNTLTYDEVTDNRFEFSAGVDSAGNISATIFDADTGYRIAGAAASGSYLRGDGSNFISGTIAVGDLPAGYVDALTDLSATLCGTNEVLEDQGGSWACISTPTSLGGEDLQQTYDLETAPALITLSDALGGIIFEGDTEVTEASFTVRDSTANKLGIVLDNDDEVATEQSPLLRLINSTAGAGDTQFDFVITAADPGSLEIRGDDGVADLTISNAGNVVGVLDITATTIASITAGNLVDKSATEVIAGAWSFTVGITLGDNTDVNRSITWDTLTADNTLTYDEVTDNRFEFSAAVDSTGAITESGNAVANSTEEGILDADVFATCDVTSDNLVDSTCVEQNAGTDINSDLEEESHNTEHASGGADDLFHERAAVWVQAGDVDLVMSIENIRMYTDASGTIKDVRCSVDTAPTTSVVTIDVDKNGVTIFTTQGNRPSIAVAAFTDVSGTPDITTYVAGDEFSIEIDAVDSGNTASDLTCQMRVRESLFATS